MFLAANLTSIAVLLVAFAILLMSIVDEQGAIVVSPLSFYLTPIFAIAIIVMVAIDRTALDFSKCAFIIPAVLFALTYLVLLGNEQFQSVTVFLFLSFVICGISCLYANTPQTVFYIALHGAVLMELYALGSPVLGVYDLSITELGIFLSYMGCCFFLLIGTRAARTAFREVTEEANFFGAYLQTTLTRIALLDSQNKVVHISQPMADLAHIDDLGLARGRPLIDILPKRELKAMVSEVLWNEAPSEASCEFTQYRKRRHFKAFSNSMIGESGALVTLLDVTDIDERDQLAAMKDNIKVGFFFMNRDFVIQDNYSRHLEEVLSDTNLRGKRFTDYLKGSLAPSEMESTKDYLDMVFDRTFSVEYLGAINPLIAFRYMDQAGVNKIFNCGFLLVQRGNGEAVVLVTVYDITARVELQELLHAEEKKRQDAMSNLFELFQVEPATFDAFLEDIEHQFGRVYKIMGNTKLSDNDILLAIYQLVHSIKSDAVTIGLGNFGSKVHEVEDQIKKLLGAEGEIPFDDMLHLTMEIEKLVQEGNGFKQILDGITAFKRSAKSHGPEGPGEFLDSMRDCAERLSQQIGKKARFVASDIDAAALETGHREVIAEVTAQLIRHALLRSIEIPDKRVSAGKSEAATIRLSIKQADGAINVQVADDGGGLDFDEIREEALRRKLIRAEDSGDKNKLLGAIFAPGFGASANDGNGVALGLVRDCVRSAGGTIKMKNEQGKGMAFSISLPAAS